MTNVNVITRHRAYVGMPVCPGTSLRTLLPTFGVQVPSLAVVRTMTDAVIADAKGAFPGRPAWSPPI